LALASYNLKRIFLLPPSSVRAIDIFDSIQKGNLPRQHPPLKFSLFLFLMLCITAAPAHAVDADAVAPEMPMAAVSISSPEMSTLQSKTMF
jgi:hypothetical protein